MENYLRHPVRLKARKELLPQLVEVMERHGYLSLTEETRERMLTISPATVDRLLAHTRRASKGRGRTTTLPGSLLKHHVPLRTWQRRVKAWRLRQASCVAEEIRLVLSQEGGPGGTDPMPVAAVRAGVTQEPGAVEGGPRVHSTYPTQHLALTYAATTGRAEEVGDEEVGVVVLLWWETV